MAEILSKLDWLVITMMVFDSANSHIYIHDTYILLVGRSTRFRIYFPVQLDSNLLPDSIADSIWVEKTDS